MIRNNDVCGVEHAKWLDNGFRRLIHNPRRMFGSYIKPGSTVMDIGCGPGSFTLDLAMMAGLQGRVIAVDLQKEMLELTRAKILKAGMLQRVKFHQCSPESLGLDSKADFILTFYMVHETPDPIQFIDQICSLLKSGGIYYFAEPKFHVSIKQYNEVLAYCKGKGLSVVKKSGIISRIAVLQKI